MVREIPSRPIIIDPSFDDQDDGAPEALFAITILSKIFFHLNVVELVRVQRTCKFWKMVVQGRLLLRRQPQTLLVRDVCTEHASDTEYPDIAVTSEDWNNTDIRLLLKTLPKTCISFYSSLISEYKSFYLLNHLFHSCSKCFYYTHQLPILNIFCLLSVQYAVQEYLGNYSPITMLLLPELKVQVSIMPLSFEWAKDYTRLNSVIPQCILDIFCPVSAGSPNQLLILFEHEFSDALNLNYAESDYDFYTFKCTLFKEFRRRFRRHDALWGGKVPYTRRFAKEASPIFTAIQITGVNVCFYSLTLKWENTTHAQRIKNIIEFRSKINLKANSLGLHLYYTEISRDITEILIGQFFPVTPFVHISLEKRHAKDNNRENIFSMNTFDDPTHQVMKYPERYSTVLIITYN